MHRHTRASWSILLCGVIIATGCRPQQPFYFHEDGDLSHYLDVATEIDYPDVEEESLDEVTGALAPLTIRNTDNYEMWDLTLEEATRVTLCNSQVMRQLGGAAIVGAQVSQNTPETISRTIINSVSVTTTYDPALRESTTGTSFGSPFSGTGVEAALSEFDAQLDISTTWAKTDRPQNSSFTAFQPPVLLQDAGQYTAGISKNTADGSTFGIRNNTLYTSSNQPVRVSPADWETNFEAFFNRPLLQGAGTQVNRIAGLQSFEQYAANGSNPIDGVVIARINTDQTLADFEGGVRNLMRDVEQSYWQLYFAYRDLEARKMGRDSALETWKKVSALYKEGAEGGSADREAQSRAQYFQFKAAVEQGLTDLYRSEARLRFVMGLAMSDGRLIRPGDEPTTAQVSFDWSSIHGESQIRRVELRKQKWEIKKRELELIAARNNLLPRLDAFGTYRWLGMGEDLINSNGGPGGFVDGSNAFTSLTTGNFQEWEVGARFSLPIGFRRQLSGVRHHQLLLARDRAIMQDLELEISHQLGDSLRDVDLNYTLTQTNFNRRVAAEREVEAVEAVYEAGRVTLDLLLDAQRRRAEAESAYYRALTDYNLSVLEVHYRKGSLLDYNGVYLAEGPWPGKAYFDAMRRARQRDASMYLDYGFTRPNVISRGPHSQMQGHYDAPGQYPVEGEVIYENVPVHEGGPVYQQSPTPATPEQYPTPSEMQGAANQPSGAQPGVQQASFVAGQHASDVRILPVTDEAPGGSSFIGSYERQADYTTSQPAGGQ